MVTAAGALLVAGVLLAGCGTGPSRVGAAAIVGDDHRITVSEVQDRSAYVLDREGPQAKAQLVRDGQLPMLSRQIVTEEVLHHLATVAAQREGITVDEAELNRAIQERGGPAEIEAGTVFDPESSRERVRDSLISAELGRRALRDLAVSFHMITEANRADALRRVEQLAGGDARQARQVIGEEAVRRQASPDQLAAVDQTLTGADLVGADGQQGSLLQFLAASPLVGVDAGTVVAWRPLQAQQAVPWLIMVVTEQDAEGAAPADPSRVDEELLTSIGRRQLTSLADELGVEISPRYGLWDLAAMAVAPNENETEGFIVPLNGGPSAR